VFETLAKPPRDSEVLRRIPSHGAIEGLDSSEYSE
jgi:hypothetical protein